jgi:hypothetical protein
MSMPSTCVRARGVANAVARAPRQRPAPSDTSPAAEVTNRPILCRTVLGTTPARNAAIHSGRLVAPVSAYSTVSRYASTTTVTIRAVIWLYSFGRRSPRK